MTFDSTTEGEVRVTIVRDQEDAKYFCTCQSAPWRCVVPVHSCASLRHRRPKQIGTTAGVSGRNTRPDERWGLHTEMRHHTRRSGSCVQEERDTEEWELVCLSDNASQALHLQNFVTVNRFQLQGSTLNMNQRILEHTASYPAMKSSDLLNLLLGNLRKG